MTEWSVQITVSAKNSFIIWQIFLTVQITHAISSSVDQYQVSASVRSLLRKRIDWTLLQFFLVMWSKDSFLSSCMSDQNLTIQLKNHDKALKILFNQSNQCQISISNWEQYYETWIK